MVYIFFQFFSHKLSNLVHLTTIKTYGSINQKILAIKMATKIKLPFLNHVIFFQFLSLKQSNLGHMIIIKV
jgi:hypothetical protein